MTLSPLRCPLNGGFVDTPGLITGGNRVLTAALGDLTSETFKIFSVAHNQSAQVGKFVYRMV